MNENGLNVLSLFDGIGGVDVLQTELVLKSMVIMPVKFVIMQLKQHKKIGMI